jgi:hypothetical protein
VALGELWRNMQQHAEQLEQAGELGQLLLGEAPGEAPLDGAVCAMHPCWRHMRRQFEPGGCRVRRAQEPSGPSVEGATLLTAGGRRLAEVERIFTFLLASSSFLKRTLADLTPALLGVEGGAQPEAAAVSSMIHLVRIACASPGALSPPAPGAGGCFRRADPRDDGLAHSKEPCAAFS